MCVRIIWITIENMFMNVASGTGTSQKEVSIWICNIELSFRSFLSSIFIDSGVLFQKLRNLMPKISSKFIGIHNLLDIIDTQRTRTSQFAIKSTHKYSKHIWSRQQVCTLPVFIKTNLHIFLDSFDFQILNGIFEFFYNDRSVMLNWFIGRIIDFLEMDFYWAHFD